MKATVSNMAFFLLPLAVALAVAGGAIAADAELKLHVASRVYIVSVAPADEESRNAENSILYQKDAGASAWTALGPCRREKRSNGDIRFTREVEAERDGTYFYTSRPVVGGKVERPPEADAPPQAVVVVDTLAPTAKITAPAEGMELTPGQTALLSWTCSDENLAPQPAALAYSTDGGTSWVELANRLAATGDMDWSVPEDVRGPVLVRLTATDLAGNVGRDLRRYESAAPAAPAAATPPPSPPPADTAANAPVAAAAPPAASGQIRDGNRSWLYYLMAVNLMRQNKPADALQYYWLSVKEDPDFIDALADIGLAYIDLGAYRTAREVVEQARDKAPERIDLMHLLGETYHAEGMARLGEAKTSDERQAAKGLIDKATFWYGQALEQAAKDWKLAEQAASFYRLGEICYYVNMDRDGARAYWKKILELHAPAPNYDLVLWTPEAERSKALRRHQTQTYRRVSLDAWQNWARGYLEQLDARERAGILDLMPAQRITAIPAPQPLRYGTNALGPGRDDGRSLFSLPPQMGSAGDVPAVCGEAPLSRNNTRSPAAARPVSPPAAQQYSFYADKRERESRPERAAPPARGKGGRSTFSGPPDPPPPPNPDPYAFPARGRPPAAWNGAGPYGDQPIREW